MNKNLNLVQILKNCPKGTKLYSLVHGDVEFYAIDERSAICPIVLKCGDNLVFYSTSGKYIPGYRGECVLFPSKENRDWSKFKPNKHKFDPKTLQPFDKVLLRDTNKDNWRCDFFSHESDNDTVYKYVTTSRYGYKHCVPYNEDTKQLLGTKEEAPEYYRYWEY